MMRVYIPATLAMLQQLVADGSLWPVNGTAFAVTPTLREAYAEGDDDELAEVALREAALASLRLLRGRRPRRHGVARCWSPTSTRPNVRPDLDDAVVRLAAPVAIDHVVAAFVDNADAEPAVTAAIDGDRRRRPGRRGRRPGGRRRAGPRSGLVRHPGAAVSARPALTQAGYGTVGYGTVGSYWTGI